jgi:hypothetical protein
LRRRGGVRRGAERISNGVAAVTCSEQRASRVGGRILHDLRGGSEKHDAATGGASFRA